MPVCTDIQLMPACPYCALSRCCCTGSANLGRTASLRAASSALRLFSAACRALRSMRSWVRLARLAKLSAFSVSPASWVSSLLLAAVGCTIGRSGAACVVDSSFLSPSPPTPLTDAAVTAATPMTATDGTATVSSAERRGRAAGRCRPRPPSRRAGGAVATAASGCCRRRAARVPGSARAGAEGPEGWGEDASPGAASRSYGASRSASHKAGKAAVRSGSASGAGSYARSCALVCSSSPDSAHGYGCS